MVSLNDSCLDICDPVQTGSEPLAPLVRTRFEPESGSDRVRTGLNQRFEPVRTGAGLNRVRTGWNPWFEPVRTGFMWFHLTTSAWTFVIRFKPVRTGSEPLVPLVRTRFEPESGSDRVRTGLNQRFEPVRTGAGLNRVRTGWNPWFEPVRTGFMWFHLTTSAWTFVIRFKPVRTGSEPLVPLVRTRFEPESGLDRVRTGLNQRFQPVRTRCRFEPGSNRLEQVVRTGSNPVLWVRTSRTGSNLGSDDRL